MCETRFERVMRLVKLGEYTGMWHPVLVEGRPVFGSENYRHSTGRKAIIIRRDEFDPDRVTAMVYLPRINSMDDLPPSKGSWRHLSPKFTAMIEFALWPNL